MSRPQAPSLNQLPSTLDSQNGNDFEMNTVPELEQSTSFTTSYKRDYNLHVSDGNNDTQNPITAEYFEQQNASSIKLAQLEKELAHKEVLLKERAAQVKTLEKQLTLQKQELETAKSSEQFSTRNFDNLAQRLTVITSEKSRLHSELAKKSMEAEGKDELHDSISQRVLHWMKILDEINIPSLLKQFEQELSEKAPQNSRTDTKEKNLSFVKSKVTENDQLEKKDLEISRLKQELAQLQQKSSISHPHSKQDTPSSKETQKVPMNTSAITQASENKTTLENQQLKSVILSMKDSLEKKGISLNEVLCQKISEIQEGSLISSQKKYYLDNLDELQTKATEWSKSLEKSSIDDQNITAAINTLDHNCPPIVLYKLLFPGQAELASVNLAKDTIQDTAKSWREIIRDRCFRNGNDVEMRLISQTFQIAIKKAISAIQEIQTQ